MNNRRLVFRLGVALLFSFAIISCKKGIDENRIIDLTDANIRIIRVEQLEYWGSPPFLFGRTNFQFLYQDENIGINYNGINDPGNLSGQHQLIDNSSGNYHLKYQFSSNRHFFTANYNEIAKPVSTSIKIEQERVRNFYDTINTWLPSFLIENPYQFRNVQFTYDPENLLQTVMGEYLSAENEYVDGEAISLTVQSWNDNNIESYRYKKVLNKVYKAGFMPFLNAPSVGIEMEVQVRYKRTDNIPKMLLRMVNQSFLDVFPAVSEDYLFNWMAYFRKDGNWLTNFYNIESTPKQFHSNWILTLSHPRFTVLPEQDQIISSKRMVGKKMVDIVNGEPVYQAVDSTATFPCTHDPVAKTLEIAGLKIWYEVVE
jgi:hypothetical protein